MNARDEILASVRRALDGTRGHASPMVPRGYREPKPVADVVQMFVERVEDYQASVVHCGPLDVVRVLSSILGGSSAVMAPTLSWTLPGVRVDDNLSIDQLNSTDAVITEAALGIAETGTIVLDHESNQGRRAITLLPDHHICTLRSDQIVANVPDAIARLDPRRLQTWISGPSATSDIELERVEGVHGPRTLTVVLIESTGTASSTDRDARSRDPDQEADQQQPPAEAPLIVVMGVSGSGKSRVGTLLGEKLRLDYVDGDDLHSQEAIAKMASGQPLTDQDREPWLNEIGSWLRERESAGGVVSCSALRRPYRDLLSRAAPSTVFLHLHGEPELLRARMRGREHFMPASLLDTQLRILEPLEEDERGLTMDIALSPEQIVDGFIAHAASHSFWASSPLA